MTNIAGSGSASGSISQRNGSADPNPDHPKCHGSATLLSGSEKGHVVLPGEAWRGPRDQMVNVLIGEQTVQHHDEGVQARHLQTE